MKLKRALLLAAVLLGGFPGYGAAMCYIVYDAQSRIVYRNTVTPIDLSGQITPALRAKFPGSLLVITDDMTGCTPVDPGAPFDPFTGAAAERMAGYEPRK
jgi:hypothetical protein